MSDTGKIPIRDARDMAKKHDCEMVVIFALHDAGDKFCITTYGKTRALCRHAADIGRKFSEAILNQTIEPAGIEPLDVPDSPAVMKSKGPKNGSARRRET